MAGGLIAAATASFQQADITSFTGYDDWFNTVVDSTLFNYE